MSLEVRRRKRLEPDRRFRSSADGGLRLIPVLRHRGRGSARRPWSGSSAAVTPTPRLGYAGASPSGPCCRHSSPAPPAATYGPTPAGRGLPAAPSWAPEGTPTGTPTGPPAPLLGPTRRTIGLGPRPRSESWKTGPERLRYHLRRPPLRSPSVALNNPSYTALLTDPFGAEEIFRVPKEGAAFYLGLRIGNTGLGLGPVSLTVYRMGRLRVVHGGAVRIPPEGGF